MKEGVTEQALIKHGNGKSGKESGDNPCLKKKIEPRGR